jgi:hypothetical protein
VNADANGTPRVGLVHGHGGLSRDPETGQHVVDLAPQALPEDVEPLRPGQRGAAGAELDRDRDARGHV